jgi:hypothetical protein
LPFSCPFNATSLGKKQQNAAQGESEIDRSVLDEMGDPAMESNQPQRAASDVFSAC